MSAENPLHRARLERGMELAEVARLTCLSPHIVQKIDGGRFAELPAGVYARAYVRAFATAVRLDPETTLAAIAERLPGAEDPLPVMRDVAERAESVRGTHVLALIGSAAARLMPLAERLRAAGTSAGPLRQVTNAWGELTLPGLAGRRIAAVGMDAAVLVLLYAVLLQLTAWTSGVTTGLVVDAAGGGVAAVWALLVVQYFVLLGGIGGRTPGAWVFRLRHSTRPPATAPLGLRAILHRTVLY